MSQLIEQSLYLSAAVKHPVSIYCQLCTSLPGRRQRKYCRSIKISSLILVLVAGVLSVKTYLDQGLWDLGEYTTTVCSEAFYHFNDEYVPDSDVFHDKELFSRCQASYDSRKPRSYGPNDSFYIKTKCGYVLPVQLNNKVVYANREQYIVPNIVHYFYFGVSWEFDFLNYLSFLGASKFIKPDHIFVHGNVIPHGPWWNRTLHEVPNLYHVHREQPVRIQGRKILRIEESANILRVQTLLGK